MRTSTADLTAEFERFVAAAVRAGLIPAEGEWVRAHLQIGSKAMGQGFRVYLRDSRTGGLSRFPGTRDNGFIGWTRGEADHTLRTMRAVLQDMPRRSAKVSDLDNTADAADWIVEGHTLDASEVDYLRTLHLPN